jgi:hypothetical protein
MPNGHPERTRREGAWIVVDEADRKLESLPYRWMTLNRTRLFVRDAPLSLDGIRSGALVRLAVEQTRRGRWWAWKTAGIDWR